MDLVFDTRRIGYFNPQVYRLLQLENGLCPSLRSFTFKAISQAPEFNPLHLPLLLQGILKSRFLCSVAGVLYDDHDRNAMFHAALLDHVDRGLLRSWELHGYLPDDYSYLSSFHNLESITFDDRSCDILDAFNSLAPLQALKYLSLYVYVSSLSIEQNMAKNACPALQELSISGSGNWMHHVLDSLAGGQIKTVTISTLGMDDRRTFIEIYRSLARLSSLQKISHAWGCGVEIPFQEYLFNVEIVQIIYPISRLIHLECLELSTWIPFTDHEISALATTFSTIKELSISSGAIPGRPTLNSLCSLASTCPNLVALSISLDVRTIPSNVVPSCCHLQRLHIEAEHTPESSVATIALLLDTLFPYLCCVEWSPHCGVGVEMCRIISMICQPARKVEKERLLIPSLADDTSSSAMNKHSSGEKH